MFIEKGHIFEWNALMVVLSCGIAYIICLMSTVTAPEEDRGQDDSGEMP